MPEERLIGTAELARLLGVCEQTVRRMRKAGRLPTPIIFNSRVVRWRDSDVQAWINQLRAVAQQEE